MLQRTLAFGRGSSACYGDCVECEYCEKAIDLDQPHYWKVQGWVTKRRGSSGGIHQLMFNEKLPHYMHPECVGLKKAGIIPGQETMWDLPEILDLT